MLREVVTSLFWWVVHLPARTLAWLRSAPGRFRRWFRANRQERWGYLWWGIAGAAVGMAKIIFFVALVLFLISLVFGLSRGSLRW